MCQVWGHNSCKEILLFYYTNMQDWILFSKFLLVNYVLRMILNHTHPYTCTHTQVCQNNEHLLGVSTTYLVTWEFESLEPVTKFSILYGGGECEKVTCRFD